MLCHCLLCCYTMIYHCKYTLPGWSVETSDTTKTKENYIQTCIHIMIIYCLLFSCSRPFSFAVQNVWELLRRRGIPGKCDGRKPSERAPAKNWQSIHHLNLKRDVMFQLNTRENYGKTQVSLAIWQLSFEPVYLVWPYFIQKKWIGQAKIQKNALSQSFRS